MSEDFAQAAHRVMMEATGRKPKTKPAVQKREDGQRDVPASAAKQEDSDGG